MEVHDDKMGRYIAQIYRKGLTVISKELQEYGIGSGQYAFLLQLYRQDGISQEELTSKLAMDKATVARAIKKLEEQDLVYRVRDETDKRCNKVFVTDKAMEMKEDIFRKISVWDETLMKSLTKEEVAQMLYLLRKIINSLMRGEDI